MTQWHEPVRGFQYQTHSLELSAQTQAALLFMMMDTHPTLLRHIQSEADGSIIRTKEDRLSSLQIQETVSLLA